MKTVEILRELLGILDTPGGHMLVAWLLIWFGSHVGSMELEMIGVGVFARGLGSAQRKEPS